MLRWLVELVIFMIAARAVSRLLSGLMDSSIGTGSSQTPSSAAPDHGVQMVRDPVCGTYVVPERAVTLMDKRTRVYFCSTACRDQYLARPYAAPASDDRVEGKRPA